MIELKSVSKTIDGKQILKDISFKLEEGEIFGLLGRNGSGKTTLLRLIQQILLPDEGDIFFGSVKVKDHPLVKCNIVYMPVQNTYFEKYNYKQARQYFA